MEARYYGGVVARNVAVLNVRQWESFEDNEAIFCEIYCLKSSKYQLMS